MPGRGRVLRIRHLLSIRHPAPAPRRRDDELARGDHLVELGAEHREHDATVAVVPVDVE